CMSPPTVHDNYSILGKSLFLRHGMMSALGQKQTHAVQQRMSALPPIATAKADIRKRSCPLYSRKQTCAVQEPMSAMGQKRTSRNLFDHLVCQQLHRILDLEPEHFCRSDIYDQLVFSWQFKRQIAGLFAPNNPRSVNCSAAIRLYLARTIT